MIRIVVFPAQLECFQNIGELYSKVVVSDSFAHGAGLMEGEDAVSLLRTHFPNSVNLGNGPVTVLATLREYGPKLKPHFVVYFYYEGNGLGNLRKEKESRLLMRFLEDPSWSQNLYVRHTVVNRMLLNFGEKQIRKCYVEFPLARLRETLTLSSLRGRIGLDVDTMKRKPKKSKMDIGLFEAILQRSSAEVKTWGGTFVVAYLPAWDRYNAPKTYNMYRDKVLNILKENEIPLVDLYPVFQKQNDVFSLFHFGLNCHYNKIGAQLVAEEVRKDLKSLPQ